MELSATSASQLKSEFMTLLVTQLQHQDPLEPVKQENFISQLAEFSTVEGIEKLNVQFADVLYSQQVLSGFDLAGKDVTYTNPITGGLSEGRVSRVFVDGGLINAVVNEQVIPIQQIVGVVAANI